jgi:TolC family type I secretion outer membrane protein
LTKTLRGALASAQTLFLCLFLLAKPAPAIAADKASTTLSTPHSANALFMNHTTYGDVIGLQPGFEAMTGKKLGLSAPQPVFKTAPVNTAPPARAQKSALKVPTDAPKAQPPQFLREAAPIYAPQFLATQLKPMARPETLIPRKEQRAIDARQRALAKAIKAERKQAIAALKKARKINVAALPRDRASIQSIAAELDRPALALSEPAAMDERLTAPIPEKPELAIETIQLTARNTAPDLAAIFSQASNERTLLQQLPLEARNTVPNVAAIFAQEAERRAMSQTISAFDLRLDPMSRSRVLYEPEDFAATQSVSPTLKDVGTPRALFDDGFIDTAPAPTVQTPLTFAQNPIDIDLLLTPPSFVSLPIDRAALSPQSASLSVPPIRLLPQEWIGLRVAAPTRPQALFTAQDYAALDAEIFAEIAAFEIALSPAARDRTLYNPALALKDDITLSNELTKEQSLAVIDMVGLPGDARILDVANEERATLVASVKNTSTQYTPQPIGVGGLETLRDAVEHAVATNPDVKIAEAQQEDAYYAINEARAGFLPKLDLNAGAGPEVSRQSGAEEIVRLRREVNATLRQTVFDFGLTQYDYRRAKESYESAKLQTLQSVEELVYEVAVAYLGVLQQQKVVALAHQNLEAHEYIVDLVTAQKDAGQGTAADVNRVSSSLSNARSFMLEEESKLQQSRDQYRRLLNAPPGLLVDPLLDLSLLPQTAQEAADRIEAESPQLLQVKADAQSIENQLRSQRGNYLPKVELEVQGNLNTDLAGETGQTRDARAMMFLRYNLYNGGADAAVAARLRARVKEIGYEFEKQRREVEQNIRNDFTAIEASRAKVDTIREQVDAAKEVVRLYEQQFRAGDRTAFDLLDAQQALISAKLEQILNSYQETRAGFRVMQQLGSLYYVLTAED